MKPKLADLRKSYEKGTLDLHNVKDNPLQLFQTWFYEAKEADAIDEANAMSLTTLGDDGFPRARVVLLKDFSEEGLGGVDNRYELEMPIEKAEWLLKSLTDTIESFKESKASERAKKEAADKEAAEKLAVESEES